MNLIEKDHDAKKWLYKEEYVLVNKHLTTYLGMILKLPADGIC